MIQEKKTEARGSRASFFSITGADGSGKSTLIAALARRYAEAGTRVHVASIWDLLRLEAARFPLRPEQIDAYLGALDSRSRTFFLLHCLSESLARARAADAEVILFDSYWYKYVASELARGKDAGDDDPRLAAARTLPEPDGVILLDVDAARALGRKEKLSGYESGFAEGAGKEAAFKALNARAAELLRGWAETEGWTTLDAARSPDEVLESAWTALRAFA